jgi:hypothetical protein
MKMSPVGKVRKDTDKALSVVEHGNSREETGQLHYKET